MKMPFDFRGKSLENRRKRDTEYDGNEWDMLEDDYWADYESLSEDSEGEEIGEAEEAYEELEYESEEAFDPDAYVAELIAEEEQYQAETYYEPEKSYEASEAYYEPEESCETSEEYYEPEESCETSEEYYESEESYETAGEYYEPEESYETAGEYYEPEESYETSEEYYEPEESYETSEEYYESEESYETSEEYYESEEGVESQGQYQDEYMEDDGAEVMPYISLSKVMDYMIVLGGVAVILVALVLGGTYLNKQLGQNEQNNLLAVGSQLDGIDMIGENGLAVMSEAQKTLLASNQEPEPTEVPQQPGYVENDYDIDVNVKLSLTSIEKDLKIKFLNSGTGKLVGNVPFGVEVTRGDGKVTFWSDDDMDGIIYKKGLESGEYIVRVQTLEDDKYKSYGLPEKEKKVEVKSKIVYEKVDIAAEIKDESQVDVKKEDTKQNDTIVEEYLQDTVTWVESTVTSESYEEVVKGNIPDPSTLAMAGYFVRLAAVEVTVAPPSTEVLVTEAPVITEVPATEVPVITEVPATEVPVITEVPATEVPVITEVPATEVPVITEVPATEVPVITEVPATEVPVITEVPATEVPVITEAPATEGPATPVPVPTEMPATTNTPKPTDTPAATMNPVPTQTPVPTGSPEPSATPAPVVITLATKTETVFIGTPVEISFEVKNKWEDAVLTAESNKPNVVKVDIKDSVLVVTGLSEGTANITVKCANDDFAAEPVVCTVVVKNDPKTDKVSLLKDAQGREVYVFENNGYRQATYADYYTAEKFYIRKEAKYTGWQTINGNVMYYDAAGRYVTGEQIIQGVKYNFSSQGALVTGSGTMGIDVSKWNGNIDWEAVKNSGVSYVIIRVGYRGSSQGALIEDSKFKSNIKGATRAGLKVGVYFFTQAITNAEAVEEASMVLECIKDYNISYPVFLDVEPSGGRADSLDKATRTEVCKAFCETIRQYGYTPGIYANKTWLETKLDMNVLNNYKIWLAQYASEPTYQGRYDMWQYKDTGKVGGISGDVDLNMSYLGY